MVYQPMLEVLAYLRANGFKTFIVSGGGIEFMRPWTEKVYGIPPEQVVGSSGKTKFEMRDGKPVLVKLPEVDFIDDKTGKPVGINASHRPPAHRAFGNSDGDLQMLEWTAAGSGARHYDAGASRRRGARMGLRRGVEDRHVQRCADGRGKEQWVDRHQHEGRLEANFRVRAVNRRTVS